MNYFELINKCLVELNYKTVRAFSELVKNDHLRIKNIMNIINTDVCGFDKWNFCLRKTNLTLPANTSEIVNTINGRIKSLKIDNVLYGFCPEYDKFSQNFQPDHTYSVMNDKLVFKKFDEEKTVEIMYYTECSAKNSAGDDKSHMVLEDDVSIIPDNFVEPILVYGTCMRLKANPQYSKFNYWYGMYKDALANMRSRLGTCIDECPSVVMKRL